MKRYSLLTAAALILGVPASYELRADPEEHKVLICHIPPGNPENKHEIVIDFSALAAHVAEHGDTEGACSVGDPE